MKLLGKKVLIRKEEEKETTASGLVLVGNQSNTLSNGIIVNISEGYVDNGVQVTISLKVGQRVSFFKHLAVEVEVDNEKLVLIDVDNLLGYYE